MLILAAYLLMKVSLRLHGMPPYFTSSPKSHYVGNAALVIVGDSLNLLQNLGSAAGFYYSLKLPMHGDDGTLIQVWVQVGVMVVSVLGFVISDYSHRKPS
jgi:hypothetical protein